MNGRNSPTAFHHGVAPIVLVFNNRCRHEFRDAQERGLLGRRSPAPG